MAREGSASRVRAKAKREEGASASTAKRAEQSAQEATAHASFADCVLCVL